MHRLATFEPLPKEVLTSCLYTADGRMVCPDSTNKKKEGCKNMPPGCWLAPSGQVVCQPQPPTCTSAQECAAKGINGMTVMRR